MTIIRRWTLERVKEERPSVRVEIGRRPICNAQVFGHNRPEALVIPDTDKTLVLDVPWEVIVDSLNTGQPIQFIEEIKLAGREPKA